MGFDKDFVWGAATASYQIEGGATADGRGESIWDAFSHTDGKVFNNHNGDVACDHYHRYKEDVKLMAELGLKAYRFSVSWSRVMPTGKGEVNPAGIAFYRALIEELEKYGIEPYITLYHWDLPYALHCQGGWLNDEIVDAFEEYTRVIAENFGDKVKNFITFNEPQVFVGCGYLTGVHAPGYKLSTRELLHIGHNVLKAHGKSVKVLREVVKDVKVGFTVASSPICPKEDKDIEAAKAFYFNCDKNHFAFSDAYWMDAIVYGRYPEKLVNECEDILPRICPGDMELISQPLDFIGLNIYTGRFVESDECGLAKVILPKGGHPRTAIKWDVVPETLYWGTKFYAERYGLPIVITENGMSAHDTVSLDGKVHDPNRIDFLHRYLRELKRSMDEGTICLGYFQWSLLDNFEWGEGYNERFGIVYVDYPTQTRILKDSALWYKEVIATGGRDL